MIKDVKSESESINKLFWFLYENEEIVPVEIVEHYEEIDREFENLHNDMTMVEEENEHAEEELGEIKDELQTIINGFGGMKRHDILERLRRLMS
jgi:hypothetical protein